MKRKRGRVGKGNCVPVLLLCSHQLPMLLENCPSLPAPRPAPSLAQLGRQEGTGTVHTVVPIRNVPAAPCAAAGAGCKMQMIRAREGEAIELPSVPGEAPHEDPKGSLTSLRASPQLRASAPTHSHTFWDVAGPGLDARGVSHGAVQAPRAATLVFGGGQGLLLFWLLIKRIIQSH